MTDVERDLIHAAIAASNAWSMQTGAMKRSIFKNCGGLAIALEHLQTAADTLQHEEESVGQLGSATLAGVA